MKEELWEQPPLNPPSRRPFVCQNQVRHAGQFLDKGGGGGDYRLNRKRYYLTTKLLESQKKQRGGWGQEATPSLTIAVPTQRACIEVLGFTACNFCTQDYISCGWSARNKNSHEAKDTKAYL